MQVRLTCRGALHVYDFAADATVADLRRSVEHNLSILPSAQKLISKGKVLEDTLPLHDGLHVLCIGTSERTIKAIQTEDARMVAEAKRRKIGAATMTKAKLRATPPTQDELRYTFGRISALAHLPNPQRSQTFLDRLAADRSIVRVMRRHKYVVGHLTELDPRLYTSHDSKILGLNKDGGAEILLRLRTDTLDGWRDYKTVRKTLIHELSHNEWAEHDANFWGLFRELSLEVEQAEGGSVTGGMERFIPSDSAFSRAALPDGDRQLSSTHKLGDSGRSLEEDREARLRAAERRRQA